MKMNRKMTMMGATLMISRMYFYVEKKIIVSEKKLTAYGININMLTLSEFPEGRRG
jgi:hypothetical protein